MKVTLIGWIFAKRDQEMNRNKYPAEISLFFIGKDYLCSRF